MQAESVTPIRIEKPEPSDERRFVRWKVAIPCQVKWADKTVFAWVDNLSFGGAFVHRSLLVPSPGESVELHICTGSDSPLRGVFRGRVAHSCWDLSKGEKAGQFGLEFKASDDRHSPRLVKLLRRFALGKARAGAVSRDSSRPYRFPPAA